MQNVDNIEYDLAEIDARARQLRAEAIRYGAGQAKAWIKSLFQAANVRQAKEA